MIGRVYRFRPVFIVGYKSPHFIACTGCFNIIPSELGDEISLGDGTPILVLVVTLLLQHMHFIGSLGCFMPHFVVRIR